MDKFNIKYYSNKEDFKANYFSKIFWDEKNAFDKNGTINKIAELFNIDSNKIKSIKNINKEIREKLFLDHKTDLLQEEHKDLESFFVSINQELIDEIIKDTKLVLNNFINILDNIFGTSEINNDIEISFIKSFSINFFYGLTYRFIPNKIFIFINNEKNFTKEELISYKKTILHEICHLFLYNHKEFQNIMKSAWENSYKYIPSSNFRNGIEEQIVNTIINGNRDFGFLYQDLKIENNTEAENKALSENIFRKLTYDFLNNLKSNSSKNKLQEELSTYIKNNVEIGMFKVTN